MNLSVVIPAYNEEGNILPLYEKIETVLRKVSAISQFEIIFVDDGSTDRTYAEMGCVASPAKSIIHWDLNRGKTSALLAGFEKAKFDLIATLDADLQNDPVDLGSMIDCITKGAHFVQGIRIKRCDSWMKGVSSLLANKIRRLVLKDSFSDISCGFRLFKKSCLSDVKFFEGAHRFLPYLIQQQGWTVVECQIRHSPRFSGKSKYTVLNRIFKASWDLMRVKWKF